jgi:hypothetical protein
MDSRPYACSSARLEMLVVVPAQVVHRRFCNLKLHYLVQNTLPLVPILSLLSPLETLQFNFILPFHLGLSKFRFADMNFAYIFHICLA